MNTHMLIHSESKIQILEHEIDLRLSVSYTKTTEV